MRIELLDLALAWWPLLPIILAPNLRLLAFATAAAVLWYVVNVVLLLGWPAVLGAGNVYAFIMMFSWPLPLLLLGAKALFLLLISRPAQKAPPNP